MSRPEWVFVCGSARGGTTLLCRLLDGHPACAVLPWDTRVRDTLMDRPLSRWVMRYASLFDRFEATAVLSGAHLVPHAFSGRDALAARLARWLEDFPDPPPDGWARARAAAMGAAPPAGYWSAFVDLLADVADPGLRARPIRVEKTPSNEVIVPLLDRVFGLGTRYLQVVRDPRAVVASWLAGHGPRGGARERAILDRCVDWARAVDRCRHHLAARGGRYHVLRYEDLVADPAATMGRVCAFLGIAPHDARTTPTHLGDAAPANSSFADGAGPGRVATPDGARPRTVLSAAEVAVIERRLAPLIRACGYPVESHIGGAEGRGAGANGGLRGAVKSRELARRRARFSAMETKYLFEA